MTRKHAGDDTPESGAEAATQREAKGSVHEAIGKLTGDDVVRERGAAEKQAGSEAVADADPSSRA